MAICQIRTNLQKSKDEKSLKQKILTEHSKYFYCTSVFVIFLLASVSTTYISTSNIAYSIILNKSENSGSTLAGNIPDSKSVFNAGSMTIPTSVRGFIIYIPDEAHHPATDNKTISAKNANYIPTNLVIPKGTAIAFVHGDPNHIHVEIIKNSNTAAVVWQTIPVSHPGGSDVKALDTGSYDVSDKKYTPMRGTITVDETKKSSGNLVVGGIFVPTNSLVKYKSDFASAGFQILSEYNFITKAVQKDISGPNTLLIYSTSMPIQDAITKLKPLIQSLPYL